MTSEWGKAIWASGARKRRQMHVCDFCGKTFDKQRYQHKNGYATHRHKFCDRKCSQKFRAK